jgi:DNA modification methylase
VTVQILKGDCRDVLRTLPDESVHCVVTSPPYFGLRDYGTATWEGGDPDCDHLRPAAHGYNPFETSTLGPKADGISANNSAHADAVKRQQYKGACAKCGAHRVDCQIGLEESPDAFVSEMVAVFREVRRVLRDDGTLWLNLGDTYASAWPCSRRNVIGTGSLANGKREARLPRMGGDLKEKDLIGIPWMVAFALRADGWYLRQDIVWQKPNPMPESVTDRCTKAHEYLFLMTKSYRYYYDAESIKEESVTDDPRRPYGSQGAWDMDGRPPDQRHGGKKRAPANVKRGGFNGKTNEMPGREAFRAFTETRNKRSVWTVATAPYADAHFATFPPALIEPCILAGCPKGGTVLDPFGGAGTTGLVSDRLGRSAILMELNPDYADMAERRISGDGGMFSSVEVSHGT